MSLIDKTVKVPIKIVSMKAFRSSFAILKTFVERVSTKAIYSYCTTLGLQIVAESD